MAYNFNKKITNARNSNEELVVKEDEVHPKILGRRVSATQIERDTIRGVASRKNFTTITPQGLPEDLIGTEGELVERQHLLLGPKSQKNEGARLPPFKPFKTISDEDNIHLLPGETGERARLNLLDTKAATKKDVQDVREAYIRMRKLYPHLYRKQQELPIDGTHPAAHEEKKPEHHHDHKKSDATPKPHEAAPQPHRPSQQQHQQQQRLQQQQRIQQQRQQQFPPQGMRPPFQRNNVRQSTYYSYGSDDDDSSYDYDSSSYESDDDGSNQEKAMRKWYQQYYASQGQGQAQGAGQYPGFPGGYAPNNNPYPMGFGPMQAPPCYNPCCEQVQFGQRQPKISVTKRTSVQRRMKKPQGLNFDFLPHDDLATEVTMTIEPDDPEPLQYAVENGIMPIICCYMPTSLAVNQQSQQQQQSNANNPSFNAGYPQGSSNKYGYAPISNNANTNSGSGEGYYAQTQTGTGSNSKYGSGSSGNSFGEGSVVTNSNV